MSIKDLFDVAGEDDRGRLDRSSPAPRRRGRRARRRPPAPRRRGASSAAPTCRSSRSPASASIRTTARLANPATLALDPTPRVPGGSTSGGAVSVAAGAAWAALGSDTGGSIRIPAALQGLVGFKSTARLVPTDGAVPLSTTLDTVSAITRSVRDAVVLHEVLADRRVALAASAARRLGASPCRAG